MHHELRAGPAGRPRAAGRIVTTLRGARPRDSTAHGCRSHHDVAPMGTRQRRFREGELVALKPRDSRSGGRSLPRCSPVLTVPRWGRVYRRGPSIGGKGDGVKWSGSDTGSTRKRCQVREWERGGDLAEGSVQGAGKNDVRSAVRPCAGRSWASVPASRCQARQLCRFVLRSRSTVVTAPQPAIPSTASPPGTPDVATYSFEGPAGGRLGGIVRIQVDAWRRERVSTQVSLRPGTR